jgi:predicted transcriptional regulator
VCVLRGSDLERLCNESGLKPQVIYERAGFNRSHYYKILKKADVSVDEFVRITSAIGHKPGDLLENSSGSVAEFRPFMDQLRRVSPELLPNLLAVTEAAIGGFLAAAALAAAVPAVMDARPSVSMKNGKTDVPALPVR